MRGIGNRCGYLAAAVLLAGTSAAWAVYPFDTMTFDNSSTVSTVASYNPPPVIIRYDYGNGPVVAGTTQWTSAADHTGNGGGSIIMNNNFVASTTAEASAFTLDIMNSDGSAVTASNISFYIQVAPGSAVNQNQGAGTSAAGSGYFAVAIRGAGYSYTNTGNVFVNGNNAGGSGWNIGDPNYTGQSDMGTWEFISIPLTASDDVIRALTFQDYNDNNAGRTISGTVTTYLDDLTITPVPEPMSLAMLGLGLPALLVRRRK